MNTLSDTAASIREINLAYLMLAQRLLRSDRSVAEARFGFSAKAADLLVALSAIQVTKLASAPHLLCEFRFDDRSMLSTLSRPGGESQAAPAEATVALA
ncbi:flagellar transcriptional regulator FlhD [Caballeronia sp. dw_276]|uniref:flagellar transcriptional regulator FlhD n=1 Tax=Caballeronia sp. dw_276 TaxID=2719795 RepID=UPI001BD5D1D7|nr:flagellar transcriptional regulator FlhD [Caballeronia sp. dw_276]